MKAGRIFLIFIFIVLVIGALFFYRFKKINHIDVAYPIKGPAVQAVYAMGTVEATVMMPIASRNQARLVELHVDEGQRVKKGQVLARLQDTDLQKALEELQAKEDATRKAYFRKKALAKQGYETKAMLDQARGDWEATKAAVARAEAEAGFMKLLAPEDGQILRRDGEIGQMISPNQTIFWFSCCAPLRISAEVDEEDIVLVEAGQKVLIRADAFPGKVFNGRVQSITPKGDPISRSYRVRIGFVGNMPLRIGMTAETNIVISIHENALLVPNKAVVGKSLWVLRNGILKKQPVYIGVRGITQTEILKGISEEEMFVPDPSEDLKAGAAYRSTQINILKEEKEL